ncbi:NAD(P)-binding protein [Alphaproteobacteria bacterium HT1-32]|nr:NAD(P)-binding protein [Alphaproteobacteria bacterium HT1-32]
MSGIRYPHVFQPLRIGNVEVRNRIMVPAHTTNFGEDNLPSQRHLDYHRARAAGGVGLIIFEAIRVHRSSLGRKQGVNGYDRACIPKFREIAEAVQAEGGRLFGQIIHLGRHIDGNFTRTPSWSASDTPWTAMAPAPHPMTVDEIREVTTAHAEVACNLLEAGLDGIELQMAHGHLLQQFLSPAVNRRTDDYGGSPENRLRFPVETLQAVRNAIGPDACLGIRISADEFLEGGLTIEDMCDIVPKLVAAAKVDFVNVSHSAYHGSYTIATQMADMSFPKGTFWPLTTRIRQALEPVSNRPVVMSVCQYRTIADAEAMLSSGDTDMVGMARAHIADPELVNKAAQGRETETIPCIGCNQGCAGMLAHNLAITCLTNPRTGKEGEWLKPDLTPATDRKRVLVIGGGPAGAEAAWTAAARGHDVTLWERGDRLGGELNRIEKMPLRAEFLQLLEHQKRRLEQYEVKTELGRSADLDSVRSFMPDTVIMATGARAVGQSFPEGGRGLTFAEALADVSALGSRIVMLDALGTWAVSGMAEYLADLGKQVTLIVPTGTPAWTVSVYSSYALRHRLREKQVRIIGTHAIRSWDGEKVQLTDLSLGEAGPELTADSVIAPLHGHADDRLTSELIAWRNEANAPVDIRSAGDCQSPRTALEAVFEGQEAGRLV